MVQRTGHPPARAPRRGLSRRWLVLAAPAAVLAALPVVALAAFAQCGLGTCAGGARPGTGALLLAGGLWLLAGVVVALPWALLRWAPTSARAVVAVVLVVTLAVAGLAWTFTTQG